MTYHANGGFTWHDLYYMPIRLREFYWRELLKVKKEENEAVEKANNKSKGSSRVIRR